MPLFDSWANSSVKGTVNPAQHTIYIHNIHTTCTQHTHHDQCGSYTVVLTGGGLTLLLWFWQHKCDRLMCLLQTSLSGTKKCVCVVQSEWLKCLRAITFFRYSLTKISTKLPVIVRLQWDISDFSTCLTMSPKGTHLYHREQWNKLLVAPLYTVYKTKCVKFDKDSIVW